jgi:hypothetical protein
MNVFRGDEEITGGDWDRYMFIDMPTSEYGVVIRFIPYSSAEVIGKDSELSEDFAFGIDIRLGVATLGSPFATASIDDQASPNPVNVLTADPTTYFAIELNICSENNNFKLALGYQQFMFAQLNSDTPPLAGVPNPGNIVEDSSGPVPFSGQGFYFRSSIVF